MEVIGSFVYGDGTGSFVFNGKFGDETDTIVFRGKFSVNLSNLPGCIYAKISITTKPYFNLNFYFPKYEFGRVFLGP